MANWNDDQQTRQGFGVSPSQAGDIAGRTTFDAGLRKHMLSIYNYMASGVLLTGIVSLLFVNSPLFSAAFNVIQTPYGMSLQATGLGWIIKLSPLAFMLFWWFGAKNANKTMLQAMFWGFCVSFGLSLSTIFVIYTGQSVAMAFFSTAAAFAGLSLFGYTTQKDLSGWGSFLIMGVVGLLVAMVLNMFIFQSGMFQLAISAIGVLIFAGLTAYDTQRLKNEYFVVRGTEWAAKAVIYGALNLYLDFINMFIFLLQMFGSRE
ncbi:Bax inhibitor-1/YccA family protein [Alteraurantiacibacter aquimixticola]|uniref:Bax inhibitor-1/YccA family protein n=1 Tax=Alteraurantiacibacter aquimixticola TaxID=2489173 RepID=A0A4T3F2B0_9SPHN|nr:Bax inhibitor-1/YccA family protein [Alteraurantiacibacter aquimixticola]TIX51383.1 Bax inhibitor-1/YccA family protein [Alteraurantiacibacter aquimixticola]